MKKKIHPDYHEIEVEIQMDQLLKLGQHGEKKVIS